MSHPLKPTDQITDHQSLRQWKTTKRQSFSSMASSKTLLKTTISNDGKKTVKYRDDPKIEPMIASILRESDRFPDERLTQELNGQPGENQSENQIEASEPNIIKSRIIDAHICSEQQKQTYGLQDEGHCFQFDIEGELRIVYIGKIAYLPAGDVQVQVYLPKPIAAYLHLKVEARLQAPLPPQLLLRSNKIVLLMQRKMRDSKNMMDYPCFVIDPSNLIYPTYLCSWIDCKRRLALSTYFQEPKQVNQHTVYGSTCHRLLEWLSTNAISVSEYEADPPSVALKLYQSMLYDMFLIGKSFQDFYSVCKSRLHNLALFFKRHIQSSEEMAVELYRKLFLKITGVVQSEIMLRSSIFGLKGKIDLLLTGELIDKKNGLTTSVYIPMELKTGRRVSDSHKRQTDIYNILVREKFGFPTVGLLYYSDSDIKFFRQQDPLSVYQIVMVHRNTIAYGLLKIFQNESCPTFPSFPQSFSQCHFCGLSQMCELSHEQAIKSQQQSENFDITTNQVKYPSNFNNDLKEQLQRFQPSEKQYLLHWLRLLHKEERKLNQQTEVSRKMGIFKFKVPFSSLISLSCPTKTNKLRLEVVHFCKNVTQIQNFDNFYKPSLKIRCLISEISLVENCKIFQTEINHSSLQFRLILQFNSSEVEYNSKKTAYCIENSIDCHLQFEPFTNQFFSSLRKSAFDLMKSNHFLKNLVLNVSPSAGSPNSQQIPAFLPPEVIQGLNSDQQIAFQKATSCQQYCLIQGMPGTGKTQLIIRLIQFFCLSKCRVLVTTFTNKALDNILERLEESKRVDPEILIRQGSSFSTSSHLHHFTSQSQAFLSIEDYSTFFNKKKAWFVTLSSLSIHHLPSEFDVVILDEASQSLEPSCIQALLRSKKFILIGDFMQLNPLVHCKEAANEGMGISLFEKLCLSNQQHSIALKKQYRMNEQIMSLSNELVYEGKLEAASLNTKMKKLVIDLDWKKNLPASFHQIIDPDSSIVFLSYDSVLLSLSKRHSAKEPVVRKVIETEIPAFLANLFKKLAFPSSSIAIITALNISVTRITELLDSDRYKENSVLTIDRSQGIDREVVILLIERGNKQLVENPRRLNVALTRAKSKLIVVASESHLQLMQVWRGNLSKLLKPHQVQLTKQMIADMIDSMSEQREQ